MSKNYDMGLLNHPVSMPNRGWKASMDCINEGPYGGMIIDYSKGSDSKAPQDGILAGKKPKKD